MLGFRLSILQLFGACFWISSEGTLPKPIGIIGYHFNGKKIDLSLLSVLHPFSVAVIIIGSHKARLINLAEQHVYQMKFDVFFELQFVLSL